MEGKKEAGLETSEVLVKCSFLSSETLFRKHWVEWLSPTYRAQPLSAQIQAAGGASGLFATLPA